MRKNILCYVLIISMLLGNFQLNPLKVYASETQIEKKEMDKNELEADGKDEISIPEEENPLEENQLEEDITSEESRPKEDMPLEEENQMEEENTPEENQSKEDWLEEENQLEENMIEESTLEDSGEVATENRFDEMAEEYRDVLSDGIYYIRTALASKKVLSVKGNTSSNKAGIVIRECEQSNSQRWKVSHDEKGYVTFKNEMSGKVLDVSNGGANADKTVWQYASNGTLAQKWIVQKEGNYYKVISALNGMVLDVKNGNSADNTGLQIYASNKTSAQKFQMISLTSQVEKCEEIISSGYYYICAKSNDKYVLDIEGGSYENKKNVQLYQANQSFAQAFDIQYKDGYYTIRNMYSNKVLDVAGADYMPTTNVWQYNYNGTNAQKWVIKKHEDGSYTFINVHNGMALDIADGKIASRSNIQVYTPNGSFAQKFVLKKAESFYGGWYNICSVMNSAYVMEIAGGNTANKTNIQLYKNNGTESQKWNAIRNSDGTFQFKNSKSKKVLDVANGDIYSGNTVWAYSYNGTAAQKWKIEKLNDGAWRIVSAIDENYVLAFSDEKAVIKSKIVIQKWNGSQVQRWTFKKTTPIKRIYQNPSQYYQIQNSISLRGGGYNLSYGYEGVKVMKVIKRLGLGSGIGMHGAFYSRNIESAVRRFQKSNGLSQTGVVNLATWQKMGYTKKQWEQWGAYVSPLKVNIESTRSEHIEAMISTAYSYLETPYVIGASGPPGTGIDCSGLVMQALYSAGIDTSPINPVRHAKPGYEYESRNMWKSSKFKHIPYSQRKRGDLIFYQNSSGVVIHVAIYLGNNKVIESWPNKVVIWPIKNSHRSNVKGVVRPFV